MTSLVIRQLGISNLKVMFQAITTKLVKISKNKELQNILLATFFIVNLLLWQRALAVESKNLEVTFFDIGQGDSALIQNQNIQIVIDGGPGSNLLSKLNSQMDYTDREIEAVVLTHPQEDHMSGLVEVFEKYKVDVLFISIKREGSKQFDKLMQLANNQQTKIVFASNGEIIETGNAKATILFPLKKTEKIGNDKELNDSSIILKLEYGKNKFLFTGDAEEALSSELIASGADLSAGILKVAHHGSKNGINNNLKILEKISPSLAIISVGEKNQYGHPHKETLDLFEKYNIKILRTDQSGDITASCSLEECSVTTGK